MATAEQIQRMRTEQAIYHGRGPSPEMCRLEQEILQQARPEVRGEVVVEGDPNSPVGQARAMLESSNECHGHVEDVMELLRRATDDESPWAS